MQIHILRSGQQFGPYSAEQAREYLSQGTLSPTDLAWHEGIDNWMALNHVLDVPRSKGLPPPPPKIPSPQSLFQWKRPQMMYFFVGLVLLIILYIAWPYCTAYSLQRALKEGNQGELENDIDFPSVRASLKEQLDAEVSNASSGSILASMASLLVHPAVDHTVDYYVTPSGIAALALDPGSQTAGESTYIASIKKVIGTVLGLNGKTPKSEGFVSVGEFVVDTGEAKLHLHYCGFGWKLDRIELTPSFNLESYMAN